MIRLMILLDIINIETFFSFVCRFLLRTFRNHNIYIGYQYRLTIQQLTAASIGTADSRNEDHQIKDSIKASFLIIIT